jgi:hypothetical protein
MAWLVLEMAWNEGQPLATNRRMPASTPRSTLSNR